LAGKFVLLVYPKDSGRLRYNCTFWDLLCSPLSQPIIPILQSS
jgi:hypothetical protein